MNKSQQVINKASCWVSYLDHTKPYLLNLYFFHMIIRINHPGFSLNGSLIITHVFARIISLPIESVALKVNPRRLAPMLFNIDLATIH